MRNALRPLGASAINPGDIIMLEHKDGKAQEIRAVRGVFDEYSSPEW
jgi:hypothetical protein